jgi:hypothetical protein
MQPSFRAAFASMGKGPICLPFTGLPVTEAVDR